MWLIVSAGVALFATRGAVLVVFLGLFLIVWLVGYWILFREYK